MINTKRNTAYLLLSGIIISIIIPIIFTPRVFGQATKNTDGFALLVTPSPIVETIKPGQSKTIELKILNQSKKSDTFKIAPRSFAVNGKKGDIKLNDNSDPTINSWVSFAEPTFYIESGQWYTQRVVFNIPKDAGFSYSLALVINRANEPLPKASEAGLSGSIAIFTLINIDRPGATKSLAIDSFKSTEGIYEYLPVEFEISLKNNGNTIVLPYGNVFIKRTNKPDTKSLAILPVNKSAGYILPNTTRTLTSSWQDGFPSFQTVKIADNTESKTNLVWDWSHLNRIRFGKYYANLVAVYNDGNRDVPIESTISFWVIPWKFMIFTAVLIVLLAFGFWTIVKKGINLSKRVKNHVKKPKAD
jgi:hypothetical protein